MLAYGVGGRSARGLGWRGAVREGELRDGGFVGECEGLVDLLARVGCEGFELEKSTVLVRDYMLELGVCGHRENG